jgi:hypothetical protein
MTMDEQVQSSTPPEFQAPIKLSVEQIEMLKAVARERAIAQAAAEQAAQPVQPQRIASPPPSIVPPQQQQQPQIIYLRRNFTVAEILLVLLLSCGIVTGVQALWGLGSRMLPQVEIKVK